MDERRVAAEVRAMTRKQVILMATQQQIRWIQAADILGISARHMSRLKGRFEKQGWDGIRDHRGSRPRRRRIGLKTIARLCRVYARDYQGFSVQHFYEHAVEHHGFRLSYTWTRLILQEAGLVAKAPSRGKYRRKRERRPLVGMLVHLDASTHAWLAGLPPQDLVVALDDADGRILYARFWPQEGTASTFAALEHVLRHQGRFAELYTDRGSHFCYTPSAGAAPDVTNDSTVRFGPLTLQLPPTRERLHYVRCPVVVHEFPDDTVGLSYQGRLLARYDRTGRLLDAPLARGRAA